MSLATLSLLRPSTEVVDALIRDHTSAALTYDAVGGTLGVLPSGWVIDDRDVVLGKGESVFAAATAAMRRWAQFNLAWVAPVRTDVPIAEGELFSFLARAFGVWSVNVCRIVYVVDERDASASRFGFAYGTVGAHSVRGEERFMVTWDRTTDEVRFGIRKFSLPANLLIAALGPVTRWIQGRFTRDALARMQFEVAHPAGPEATRRAGPA